MEEKKMNFAEVKPEEKYQDMMLCNAYFDREAETKGPGARLERYMEKMNMGIRANPGLVAAGVAAGIMMAPAVAAAGATSPFAYAVGMTLVPGAMSGLAAFSSSDKYMKELSGVLPRNAHEFVSACLQKNSPAERLGVEGEKMTWADRMTGRAHVRGMVHVLSDRLPRLKETQASAMALKAVRLAAEKPIAEFSPKDFRLVMHAAKACDRAMQGTGMLSVAAAGAEDQAKAIFEAPFAATGWKTVAERGYGPSIRAAEAMDAAGQYVTDALTLKAQRYANGGVMQKMQENVLPKFMQPKAPEKAPAGQKLEGGIDMAALAKGSLSEAQAQESLAMDR